MTGKGRIAVSGATGFVGSRLVAALKERGYEVAALVRHKSDAPDTIFYDYENRVIESEKLATCSAVIHLAGKNIFGLWTPTAKHDIYDSRVKSTRFLAHSLAKIDGPRILLNASACGIYGDRADQKLDETSSLGTGFLAKLCTDWERGTLFAKEAGIRVVKMRIGIVLDKEGGALKAMLPMFKRGLGALMGNGEQYFPYITRDDLVREIIFLLESPTINGPVNCVSYEPTTHGEFARALAGVFGHKVHLRVPSIALKMLGEQGSMLLSSQRVYPNALLDHRFAFREHESIETVLRTLLL